MANYNLAAARTHMETTLGYQFGNPDLLQEALHAGGPIYIGGKLIDEANKRLAIIGDSALDLALAITDYQGGLSRGKARSAVLFCSADVKAVAISNRRSSALSKDTLPRV